MKNRFSNLKIILSLVIITGFIGIGIGVAIGATSGFGRSTGLYGLLAIVFGSIGFVSLHA